MDAEFVVDVHPSVDFFAAVAVGFEAVMGFEKLDLGGVFRFLGGRRGLRAGFFRWLLRSLLRLGERKKNGSKQKR